MIRVLISAGCSMAILKNKIMRQAVLTVLLGWSLLTFWLLGQGAVVNIIFSAIYATILILIWTEKLPLAIVISLSFSSAYALYGFLFYFNLPLWVILLAALIIYSYLFTYFEQKSSILGMERLVYLALFGLIITETFLFLSYFLISPVNRSLIVALVVYTIVGFVSTIIKSDEHNKFYAYGISAAFLILICLVTANWGSIF
jgi:hypothetical protein